MFELGTDGVYRTTQLDEVRECCGALETAQ
jgi:hypothetical protein